MQIPVRLIASITLTREKFMPQNLTPDFKAYNCVINSPYLSIGIHIVMQISFRLIPLITLTREEFMPAKPHA
jgi:hypothetical protein